MLNPKKKKGLYLVFLPQLFCILFLHFKHSPFLCGILCIVQLKGQTEIPAPPENSQSKHNSLPFYRFDKVMQVTNGKEPIVVAV